MRDCIIDPASIETDKAEEIFYEVLLKEVCVKMCNWFICVNQLFSKVEDGMERDSKAQDEYFSTRIPEGIYWCLKRSNESFLSFRYETEAI